MTAVNTDQLLSLSRTIAGRIDPRVQIVGVTSADGGGTRAELLVSIAGCHTEPCVLELNVDRTDPGSVERDLSTQLTAALSNHITA